ncbi:hypothetical protein LCGC14_2238260, partial [marine sediment metagenome]
DPKAPEFIQVWREVTRTIDGDDAADESEKPIT